MTREETNYKELYMAEKKENTKLKILLSEAEETILRQEKGLRPLRENTWDENI